MAHYENAPALVQLQHIPQQVAFLRALAARFCANNHTWAITFGDPRTKDCPVCGQKGQRDFTKMLLLAGRQGGKTRIGTLGGVLEASMPNSRGWVSAPTYRDLVDFVEPAFFAQLPRQWLDEGDWDVSNRILTLPNNAVISFRSLHDPQIARGPELDWWLMDEACQVSEDAHEVGDAMLSIRQGVEILTTTPQGEDWVYEKVYLHAKNAVPGFWFATWKSADNPSQSREFLEQKRATMSPEMFAQEYEASIVSFKGAIYGGSIDPCVIDDATDDGLREIRRFIPSYPIIPSNLRTIIGLDPGSDHPFAGAAAVVTPMGLVVLGEYEERQLPIALHAINLKKALTLTPQSQWCCDRSQAQTMLELAQHGIFAAATESGPGSVVAGIERCKTWMLSGRLIFVKSKTPRLVARLKSYRWADTKKNDGSTGKQEPYKRGDDLCDAFRYLLMSWPHLPEPIDPLVQNVDPGLSAKDLRDMERFAKHVHAEGEKVADGIGEFHQQAEDEDYGQYDSMYASY